MQKSWNFLAAQTGIVARIESVSQSGPDAWCRVVGTRKDLAAVSEEMQTVPAVYVVYDGFAVLPSTNEQVLVLSHRWLVVLAVGTAASQKDADRLDQLAGPYLGQLIQALHGFTPEGCREPLVMSTPPRPYYSPARYAYYPLLLTNSTSHC